ncbi:MAG TPA: hypothetical protein VGQ76_21350 [Thermoanaerobaculia bacterium]|nr:hypothetical protein [Thermoanaerobaculia bacterium]
MKRRLISLLILVLVLAIAAPIAMADHCRKCNAAQRCAIAATGGYPSCDDSGASCVLTGQKCTGPHPLVEETFAASFTVASVERLDEPRTPASETRVASLETTHTINR